MKIPNDLVASIFQELSLARIVSEDSQRYNRVVGRTPKSSKDS